jgi:phage baseplate assembly protein W|tara:strand:+ start:141 stop:539 length:399 start_codon:yes stop_codon:yes gene_type:complete
VAGISRTFKDISLSFKRHPVTNDIISLKNEDAIKRSVQNIVLTMVGEKAFVPYFGTNVNDSLFNLNTSVEAVGLKEQITTAINNFEPRVNNLNITVTVDADSNDMYATIEYDIIGLPVPTQGVEVLLFPARV